MNIAKAEREAILSPLTIVAGAIERKHTLPILSNVLMRRRGNQVSFTGTDLEMEISTSAGVGGGVEDSAITVSARKLVDVLKAMPSGEVDLSMGGKNGKSLVVRSGKSKFSLQTLDSGEYPTMKAEESGVEVRLPSRSLRHILAMVQFAMATQDVRYYLNGALLVVDGKVVRAVATDGHRLAMCETRQEQAAAKAVKAIVPRKTVHELVRLLPDSDDEVSVKMGDRQLRFQFGEIVLTSKVVEGAFPDYERVVPKGHAHTVGVDREGLAAVLRRASIMTGQKFRGARCTFEAGGLRVRTVNEEQEEAEETIDIEYDGEPIEIGFNVDYLREVAETLTSDKVNIGLKDGASSAIVTPEGSNAFAYVCMPMRV